MKQKNLLIIIIVLIIIVCAFFISNKIRDHKNTPILQSFPDVNIAIIAPPMKKSIQNERMIKDTLNNKISDIAFYKTKYKNFEYLLVYTKYSNAINLKSSIDPIIKLFKSDNFTYKVINNEVKGNKGILLEGTFERNEKIYAIKEQLIKKSNILWQAVIIYPSSEKNNALAQNYINSIDILND
jgi:hypothetical protein